MTVGVTKGLNNIAGQLRYLGYDVVDYETHKQPIDALVYKGNMLSAHDSSLKSASGGLGVLMVNASNMSIGTIDATLKNRIYSPLDFC